MIEATKKTKKNLILLFLLLISGGPFVASWWLFNFTDIGRDGGAYSHGELIVPPRQIENLNLYDSTGEIEKNSLYGKWTMVFLIDQDCDSACEEALYMMRQINIAMNNNAHRVQRVLISLRGEIDVLTAEQHAKYKAQRVAAVSEGGVEEIMALFETKGGEETPKGVFLVDPLGNLMMRYSFNADPSGVIKDLKRLLKYSRIG